ncbi:MAG: nickel/cobalt efflux transporter [Alphaproteobacteria bacterium]|jgi:nickel/cobalt transporter (NicO) family protein|nr:nickel/cobalt efflux transporter RcnA [Rhodospirillaceae bacterium]MBT7615120.1 nickel/cobalt efflux transporter RcnA [Rhodospirillaceae bacterium]MBT7648544.1 nickel/cobalt efflux transporter RcnA [Rhodospirillaceae bacterium]MDG2480127.1 nickel/cobalt efflux transporter [Alphaproteobacteria bacterium]
MDIASLITDGTTSTLVLFMMALLLGAFHGLEPGHSKTMMAAYIIATRGTPIQALLLGLSAALSHSVIVWVLAILGLLYGDALIGEQMEPIFMMVSGGIFLVIALWFALRVRRQNRAHAHHHHHNHDHGDHDHSHHHHDHGDAHARAHAADIERRLADGRTGTWQTILFGLTGGLIPCPAAITVLILCLNIGQFWRGMTLVSAFSLGLALTLVTVGLAAAVGTRYVNRRTSLLNRIAQRAPYASSALIAVLGLVMIVSGMSHGAG